MYESISEQLSPARQDGQHVLLVVGDPDIVELLSTTLGLAGYQVGTARTGSEAAVRLAERRFDLLVIDVTLSDLQSLARGNPVPVADRPPVLFLTTCDFLGNLVPVLGPHREDYDYVTVPFRITEFLARARVLTGGRGSVRQGPHYGDLVLDDATCQARRGQRLLDLTPAEYRLLRHLLVNAERVLSKEQIGRQVRGEIRADSAIEKLLSRLRCKVNREEPPLIHTRRGFGYWLGRSAH